MEGAEEGTGEEIVGGEGMDKEKKLGMIFNSLAEELNITETMLEKAKTAYTALGEYIKSSNEDWEVLVYPQGSFELGTVVKPLNEDEQYDVDLVVLVKNPNYNPEELRNGIKELLEKHGRYVGKIQDKKPCIRIQYADSSQFHMDVASAQDIEQSRDESIKIARYDGESYYYDPSNPKGYVEWFKNAMKFEKVITEYRAFSEKASTEVEKLDLMKFRTPLQKAIQILKRHRDIYFTDKDNSDDRPSSIIITTLCALTYDNSYSYMSEKENVYLTIKNMLQRFPEFIKKNLDGEWCLLNPSNSQENFLKKWKDNGSLKNAFDEWIQQARIDILVNPEQFIENNQIELRSGILKSFGESAGIGALNRYGTHMSELKENSNLRFDRNTASITVNEADNGYEKHTYFGGDNI